MTHSSAEIFWWVLLDAGLIVIVARIFGRIAVRLRQPRVVGEIVAGIALGPSLLGLFPGHVDDAIFPPDAVGHLSVLAQLGLVVFMFLVGLELNMSVLRGRRWVAGAISMGSIVVPFGFGVLLALYLYPRHASVVDPDIDKLTTVLFVGVAMSITAFPVLARILAERRIQATPAGVFSIASAAIVDVIAWTLLAVVVALAKGDDPSDVLQTIALATAFTVFMYTVGRRAAARLTDWYSRKGRLTAQVLGTVLVGALLSSWVTEMIGIHAIFGAFVFGTILPRNETLVRDMVSRLEQITLLLLPIFFVITGLQVDVGALPASGYAQLALIVVVAIAGKLIGVFTAARCSRLTSRESLAIAVLTNTRGLTELVILSLGRELGILDGEMFTIFVLMALVTTLVTAPLIDVIYPAADEDPGLPVRKAGPLRRLLGTRRF